MSTTILIASPSATVQKMVSISLANLPCQLIVVDSETALLSRLADTRPKVVIATNNSITDQTLRQINDSSEAGIVLLGPIGPLDRGHADENIRFVEQPVHSQRLVVAVCELVDWSIPHQTIYAPYMMDIPLAQAPEPVSHAPAPEETDVDRPIVASPERAIAELSAHADSALKDGDSLTQVSSGDAAVSSSDQSLDSTSSDANRGDHIQATVDDTRTDLPQRFISDTPTASFDSEVTAVDHLDQAQAGLTNRAPIDQTARNAITERVAQRMTETISAEAVVRDLPSELVERVIWEVVPELAEALIKEEIARLMASQSLQS
ncbi:MAG: hypothetical protein VX589_18975 [Myxococcota bacterium]|nr:hypothetical protein [Myxococcota bacterium]